MALCNLYGLLRFLAIQPQLVSLLLSRTAVTKLVSTEVGQSSVIIVTILIFEKIITFGVFTVTTFRAASIIGIIGIVVLIGGYFIEHGITLEYILPDLYANFGAEFISISITVLVIDYLSMRREEKERVRQLIRDLGSQYSFITHRAIGELRSNPETGKPWLSDGTLHYANLIGANLENAMLDSSSLCFVKLTGANLKFAFLTDSNLEGADLRFADLEDTNFENANLTNANFSNANLIRTNFCGANLSNANFNEASLKEINYNKKTTFPLDFPLTTQSKKSNLID